MNDQIFDNHAKCILVGEHAVIRNHPAITFPLQQFRLLLKYTSHQTPLQLTVLTKMVKVYC